MSDDDAPARRTFSYAEAVAALPEVRRLTENAQQRVAALQAEVETRGVARGAAQSRLDAVVAEWAEAIMDLGIQVKGLWLVDFDNGSGCYCWRYPEPALHHYHSYEEGFSGRVPIA